MKGIAWLLALLPIVIPAQAQVGHERFFDANGVQIHYQVIGEGPPVILLHGYASDFAHNWQDVTPVLAEAFTVIGVDLRGHGRSDAPRSEAAYGVAFVDDVVRLMDHLELDQAHVAGYSLGGMIALKLAVTHPDRVTSVVLGGSGHLTQKEIAKMGQTYADAFGQGTPASEVFGPGLRGLTAADSSAFVEQLDSNDPAVLAAMARSFDALAVSSEEATTIDAPICAIVGANDSSLPSVQRLAGVVPFLNAISLQNRHHLNAFFDPEFANAMQAFLTRVDADGGKTVMPD